MKNRKLFFKRFVMGIVIFFMAVFELQMIWGSVYISKTVTKERRNSYASALEIYSSNLEQQYDGTKSVSCGSPDEGYF